MTITVTNPLASPGVVAALSSPSITVSCDVSITSGAVTSVTADLTILGGGVKAMTNTSGNHWSWMGTVNIPFIIGPYPIFINASDGLGNSGNNIATILVNPPV